MLGGFILIAAVAGCGKGTELAKESGRITAGDPVTGAIFTTLPDGSAVNANVQYTDKIQVYLDGGPRWPAPTAAAALQDGIYVFQVTDPSGALLLSQDPALCREVVVTNGVITALANPNATYGVNGKQYPCSVQDSSTTAAGTAGRHDLNSDTSENPGLDPQTVQLMPFGDTPNPGGVYKAWMTPLADYTMSGGNVNAVPLAIKGKGASSCPNFCAAADPGFVPRFSKTDNFKVKGKVEPPEIFVYKFHDRNGNGVKDADEEWVDDWSVTVTEPSGSGNVILTSDPGAPDPIYAVPSGTWSFTEAIPTGVKQTASYVGTTLSDLAQTSPFPENPVPVVVTGTSGETHTVVFGNVGLGQVVACKVYDADADGVADKTELTPVVGWQFTLAAQQADSSFLQIATGTTGADGCTNFATAPSTSFPLMPGTYRVTEVMAPNWLTAMTLPYQDVVIQSQLTDGAIRAPTQTVTFANYCTGTAEFGTKGYWHNNNGVAELTEADVAYVNGLAPFASPTAYWPLPFDGWSGFPYLSGYYDGVFKPTGNSYFGTDAIGEISDFLTAAVNASPTAFQMSEQLLAFVFNARHRLDSPSAILITPSGSQSAQSIIDAAIADWVAGDVAAMQADIGLLDGLNSNVTLPYVKAKPCDVVYPPAP